jgi:hypothetical protein
VRIQNLRKYREYASAGINAGSLTYGDHCDPLDDGTLSGANCQAGRTTECLTAWCFQMFLQEPECLDQWHVAEDVSWLALEAGSYVTNEGLMFQAGTASAHGATFERVGFVSPFPSGEDPVVLSHVQVCSCAPSLVVRLGQYLV